MGRARTIGVCFAVVLLAVGCSSGNDDSSSGDTDTPERERLC
jgi:hypothetical protein